LAHHDYMDRLAQNRLCWMTGLPKPMGPRLAGQNVSKMRSIVDVGSFQAHQRLLGQCLIGDQRCFSVAGLAWSPACATRITVSRQGGGLIRAPAVRAIRAWPKRSFSFFAGSQVDPRYSLRRYASPRLMETRSATHVSYGHRYLAGKDGGPMKNARQETRDIAMPFFETAKNNGAQ